MSRIDRRALTLIELAVVIAIVGLLFAITLPAVNSARESARRVECVSRLGQLGLALHSHQSSMRFFPPAMPAMPNQTGSTLWYAPHQSLLPYIEEAPLYSPIDLFDPIIFSLQNPGQPAGSPPGSMVPWTRVTVFRCPSDENQAGRWAGNSYRVCTGPGTGAVFSSLTTDGGQGAFRALSVRTPADFTDGLSCTIGASEKLMGSGLARPFSPRFDFWYSGAALVSSKLSPDGMASACAVLSGPPVEYYGLGGSSWYFAGYENSWYNHVLPPNSPTPDCAQDFMLSGMSPASGGGFGARSYHPGGVNCLYMDASVRFVSDTVDLELWRAIATCAGGEGAIDIP